MKRPLNKDSSHLFKRASFRVGLKLVVFLLLCINSNAEDAVPSVNLRPFPTNISETTKGTSESTLLDVGIAVSKFDKASFLNSWAETSQPSAGSLWERIQTLRNEYGLLTSLLVAEEKSVGVDGVLMTMIFAALPEPMSFGPESPAWGVKQLEPRIVAFPVLASKSDGRWILSEYRVKSTEEKDYNEELTPGKLIGYIQFLRNQTFLAKKWGEAIFLTSGLNLKEISQNSRTAKLIGPYSQLQTYRQEGNIAKVRNFMGANDLAEFNKQFSRFADESQASTFMKDVVGNISKKQEVLAVAEIDPALRLFAWQVPGLIPIGTNIMRNSGGNWESANLDDDQLRNEWKGFVVAAASLYGGIVTK